jgi:lipoic acid synthetase
METCVRPAWLNKKIRLADCAPVERVLDGLGLHTVCQEAACPNRGECFSRAQATFLILGNVCTRNCTFCAVCRGNPQPPDAEEAARLVEAVKRLALSHVVVTSVTRDDLSDGGASVFGRVVACLRAAASGTTIELLIPDFRLDQQALEEVAGSFPDILAHNLETVPRLYPALRPDSDYRRSCRVLRTLKKLNPALVTKSGLMLGLGETRDEVCGVMDDLRECGVDELTLGQYLAPSRAHYRVREFVHPDVFSALREQALSRGFTSVSSGPYVRSSYRGALHLDKRAVIE